MNLFELNGEVAVVIGGTGVLGGALAEGLAAAGASVAVIGRNAERGQGRAKSIHGAGGRADFFPADSLVRAELQRAHAAIRDSLGAPTILVNAAGGNDPKATVTDSNRFEDMSLDAWRG